MDKGEGLGFLPQLLSFTGQFIGFSRWLWPVPHYFWQHQENNIIKDTGKSLAWLIPEHRSIYRLALKHLAETATPLEIIDAAALLNLTIDQAEEITGDLEKHTGLAVRNANGTILSAYPVTLEKPYYHLILTTGKEMGTQNALDAIALAPVMSQLRGEDVSGHVTIDCAFCRRPLHVIVKGNLLIKLLEENISPRVFIPLVTAKAGTEGILICLKNAVWYCTPEHASEHRHQTGGVFGCYLTLDTAAGLMKRIMEQINP
jgi:hypothetical protein